MKKTAILSLAFFMLFAVGCQKEQPTIYSLPDKYTIQEDTNWVEITDIDTLHLCIGWSSYWIDKDIYVHQIVNRTEDDYKILFEDAISVSQYFRDNCGSIYQPSGIDFSKRIMIMYTQTSTPSYWTRKIFYNEQLDEYYYLLEIKSKWCYGCMTEERLDTYRENITIPKFTENTKVIFDTLHTYSNDTLKMGF
ncbi:MAG TPA: hypothetical protein PLC04_07700 [Candidatus Kapabacteria bacterium]|nr:hypothetical protein [Candidatus Kapabacteria bacterium]